MANDRKVSLLYTKILALGPSQVGKSTFLYRLTGLMKANILLSDKETLPQGSTGFTELKEACITYSSKTGAVTSQSSESQWQVFDESSALKCQLNGLMSLVVEQTHCDQVDEQTGHSHEKPAQTQTVSLRYSVKNSLSRLLTHPTLESTSKTDLKPSQLQTIPDVSSRPLSSKRSVSQLRKSVPQESNISKIIKEFERIQSKCKADLSHKKFQMLFNVADIGGQPAFLEMLPSLTIGPAFYLIFTSLEHGLTLQYPVAFKCRNFKEKTLCKNYTYTSEEVIFTALSSIACFGHSDKEVEKYVTGDNKQTNSLALLIGTFRDKIEDEKELDRIDTQLEKKLEGTDFFNDGLIYSKSFERVNNYSAEEEEIIRHRKLFEEILSKKFHKYEIPTRWLNLSIMLKLFAQRQNRFDVCFDDCVTFGKYLGMKKEMVKVALQFLHKYVGLVIYFPKNPYLKNIVICDPQVVFYSISELIFNIYDPRKMHINEAQHDCFVRTGCFSPQDIKDVSTQHCKKNLLSVDTLVELLAHLNIVAEVPFFNSRTTVKKRFRAAKKYYFLPAVLQTAKMSLLIRDVSESEELLPEPLCIRFQTGYLPLGFICALSANLIAESKFNLIPFEVDGQQITYKNKMKFRFQGEFDITMVSYLTYCEFRVSRCTGTTEFWESKCCPRIKTKIFETASRVVKALKQGSLAYKQQKELTFELAFRCPKHKDTQIGHEPMAKIPYDLIFSNPNGIKITCVDPSCATSNTLSPEMKMWFGEVSFIW